MTLASARTYFHIARKFRIITLCISAKMITHGLLKKIKFTAETSLGYILIS